MQKVLARSRRSQTVTNKNTPRSIRARLQHPRRKAASEAPLPDSPTQQVARSSSGRMALGPWMGSFGGMDEFGGLADQEPLSPTLFATSRGRVFADLLGSPVHSGDLGMAAANATAPVSAPQPEAGRDRRRAQVREMTALKRKAEEGRGHGGKAARGPHANAARRRYRMIGQARKAN